MFTRVWDQAVGPDIESMLHDSKAVRLDNGRLPALDLFILELKDVPTGTANDVVVMVVFVGDWFVPCLTIAKLPLFSDSRFYKQLHGAVHGCVSDTGYDRMHPCEHLVEGDMPVDLNKTIEERTPLPGRFQTRLLQVRYPSLFHQCSRVHTPSSSKLTHSVARLPQSDRCQSGIRSEQLLLQPLGD